MSAPQIYEKIEQLLAEGKTGQLSNPKNWPELVLRDDDDSDKNPNMLDGANNLIADMARAISEGIQFPASTAYVHGLGILASAMTRNFRVRRVRRNEYGKVVDTGSLKPCNLYVLTAQPPSSGKSAVNDNFQKSVWDAYERLNKARLAEYIKVQAKIDALKVEKKTADSPQKIAKISAELADLFEQAKGLGQIEYTFDDATPEAIDSVCGKQSGFWTVTSTEGQSLMSLIGGSYSSAGKDPNANVVLKSWAMERSSSARVSREGSNSEVYATIAIIAQEGSIDLLIENAKRGIGLPDRFLMFDEPNLFGSRDHTKGEFIMPAQMRKQYADMIGSIVTNNSQLIAIGDNFDAIVGAFLNSVEPHLADGGRLGHPTIRGFYGKAFHHITKIACVLHVAKEWGPGGSKEQEISDDTIREAITMFKKFGLVYRKIVDDSGASGVKTEREAMIKALRGLCERRRRFFFKNEEIRQQMKNSPAFKGRPKLNQYLRDTVYKELHADGYVYLVDDGVYVNPLILR